MTTDIPVIRVVWRATREIRSDCGRLLARAGDSLVILNSASGAWDYVVRREGKTEEFHVTFSEIEPDLSLSIEPEGKQ